MRLALILVAVACQAQQQPIIITPAGKPEFRQPLNCRPVEGSSTQFICDLAPADEQQSFGDAGFGESRGVTAIVKADCPTDPPRRSNWFVRLMRRII